MSVFQFLKHVPLFADLSDEDLSAICENAIEVDIKSGELLFAEGDPGDKAYIIEDGVVEIIKKSGGRDVLLAVRESGSVIGEMGLLDESPRTASIRARTQSRFITIHKETMDSLLASSPSASRAILRTVLKRTRATLGQLRQSEQMAQLGTLTAGVAHELNNPAAAVKRGSEQLLHTMQYYAQTQSALILIDFSVEQQIIINELAILAQTRAPEERILSALDRSNLEQEIEDWLYEVDIENPWELAPAMVDLGFSQDRFEELKREFSRNALSSILNWVVAMQTAHTLLWEIGDGAGRISEIVKALKSYAYLDQAPIQSVNVHEGLNNTLVILRHKLKEGIGVHREYDPDLPKIEAYGSELNQVWTNLIDNAADALEGKGIITIKTYKDENEKGIFVEIQDNGPGIPENIQPRIYDAFFTTKPPGKGTGLGLNISYNIVVYKHSGDIEIQSSPGNTTFKIWLPLDFEGSDKK